MAAGVEEFGPAQLAAHVLGHPFGDQFGLGRPQRLREDAERVLEQRVLEDLFAPAQRFRVRALREVS
ncbi:hypothetical protein SAM9427_28035 [Streptomyces sp. ETH9427]|nr:hypothetical protein SAM9427_28035 [Streptomyces sp. ETH9427]